MAEGLQYKIGADVTDFKKAMDEAVKNITNFDIATQRAIKGVSNSFKSLDTLENQLQRFKTGLSNATDPGSFARLQRAIDATKDRIALMSKPLDALNRGLGQSGVRSTASGAASSLNALGQVARDLPFGFIAIQNNLPILFDQFGALVKQSGGLGGALKSLGGALLGPTGVTFAIGALIAGVTTLIQKYGSLGAATEAIFNSNDRLYQTKKNLADINKEGNKQASEELARLTVLNAVATDVTNGLDNRKEAANELLKVYKEYLPNLTQEAILNNDAADAINRAKDAILAKALAAAAETKLAEIGAKILDIELKRLDQVDRFNSLSKQRADIEAKSQKNQITGAPKLNTQISTQVGLLNDVKNEITGIDKELSSLQSQFTAVTALAAGFAQKAGDAFIKDSKPGKTKEKLFVLPELANVRDFERDLQRELDKQIIDIKGLDVPLKLSPKIPANAQKAFDDFAQLQIAKLENRLDQTKQFSDALAAQLSSSFSDVFTSVGEGIGGVFAGVASGFSIAQTVLSGLADVLINVGKLAISTGVAILGIKKALQTLNPAVAIAGGVALVALGSAVKGKLSKSVPKFAEGGIVTRPTAGIFGEAGPEAVMPLDKLNSMLGSFGGGNVQVSGSFALSGNNLVASIARTNKQQGRAF